MIKGETKASVWATKFQQAILNVTTKEGIMPVDILEDGYEFKDLQGDLIKIKFIIVKK